MSTSTNDRNLGTLGVIKGFLNDGKKIASSATDLAIINLGTFVNMSIANQFDSKVDDVDDIMDNVDRCHANADNYETELKQTGLTARQKANLKTRMELYDDIGREGVQKARTLR